MAADGLECDAVVVSVLYKLFSVFEERLQTKPSQILFTAASLCELFEVNYINAFLGSSLSSAGPAL